MGLYEQYFSESSCTYYIIFFVVTLIIGIFLISQVYTRITWTSWGSGRGALGAIFIIFSIIGILGILVRSPGLVFFSVFLLISLIVVMIATIAVSGMSDLYPIRVDPTIVAVSPTALTPAAV